MSKINFIEKVIIIGLAQKPIIVFVDRVSGKKEAKFEFKNGICIIKNTQMRINENWIIELVSNDIYN